MSGSTGRNIDCQGHPWCFNTHILPCLMLLLHIRGFCAPCHSIYQTPVHPGRVTPHMWLSLRFSLLLLKVKDRGCCTLLSPMRRIVFCEYGLNQQKKLLKNMYMLCCLMQIEGQTMLDNDLHYEPEAVVRVREFSYSFLICIVEP